MKTAALVVPGETYAGFREPPAALDFGGTWIASVPYAVAGAGGRAGNVALVCEPALEQAPNVTVMRRATARMCGLDARELMAS